MLATKLLLVFTPNFLVSTPNFLVSTPSFLTLHDFLSAVHLKKRHVETRNSKRTKSWLDGRHNTSKTITT
ncbi:hypothetical protein BRADI_3g20826v3 [Brachypodium distachyon]|uniref:Secreted protein n=1 Tax=Brachypodium distachyon TaxID=15368 RepID=A0A0Q3LUP9_BRADI|nr:hypothetical protein BRADI_3g20826v3 [Brachypodium distachyon]